MTTRSRLKTMTAGLSLRNWLLTAADPRLSKNTSGLLESICGLLYNWNQQRNFQIAHTFSFDSQSVMTLTVSMIESQFNISLKIVNNMRTF